MAGRQDAAGEGVVTAIPLENTRRNADALVDLLVDEGPMTSAECCARLGWTKGRFDTAVKVARDDICPDLGLAIPHPTPQDAWRYQVTTDWQPVEAGAAHALGMVESRLRSIHRDVRVVKPMLDPRSRQGRRANFLDKHLSHLLGTLKEINDG